MRTLRRSSIAARLVVLVLLFGSPHLSWCTEVARASRSADGLVAPDLRRVTDAKAWRVINGEVQLSNEGGRPTLRLSPLGGNRQGSNVAMALVRGVHFAHGQIDVDLLPIGFVVHRAAGDHKARRARPIEAAEDA